MSFYKSGIGQPTSWFPQALEPLRNQAGEIIAGVRLVRAGERRMLAAGTELSPSPVAPGVPGVVGFVKDIGAGLAVLAGIFVVASALGRAE